MSRARRLPAGIPERIGGYELLLPIASGGMGAVYLAEREVAPGVSRFYAVKVMHRHLQAAAEEDDAATEQILREAQLAARIQHPNVVTVHDTARDDDEVYLVMDYVEGTTLGQMVATARKRGMLVPIDVVGRVICDALCGLHAAHEARDASGRPLSIIHRDVSPQNILIGLDGMSRLTDFGVAKAADRQRGTATGVVKGKLGYMAPEQASGKPLDRRCDVWSAGVVLWEALAGRRLFDADTDAQRLMAILSGPPAPRVSSVRLDAPAEIDEVVRSALERDPRKRIADADQLRRAITVAWSDFGLASRDAVARLVRELTGERLDARRREVDEIRALRKGSVAEAPSPSPPPRRQWPLIGAAFVVGGSVAALAFALHATGTPDRALLEPRLAALSSQVSAAAAESPVSAPESPPTSESPPTPDAAEAQPAAAAIAEPAPARPRPSPRRGATSRPAEDRPRLAPDAYGNTAP